MTTLPYGILPLVLTLLLSFTQEAVPKLSPAPPEVATAFFAAFETGDFAEMKPHCTDACVTKHFTPETAFGLARARLVAQGESTFTKENTVCSMAVTVETIDPKNKDETERTEPTTTAMYLTMQKQTDGSWKIDALRTTPPEDTTDPATAAVRTAFQSNPISKGATITACVAAPDKAQGLLGVVQYTDAKQNPLNYAFVLEKDCIPYTLSPANPSVLAQNSKLRYLGKGKIGFLLLDSTSQRLYDYTLTFTQEGSRIKFQAESQERAG